MIKKPVIVLLQIMFLSLVMLPAQDVLPPEENTPGPISGISESEIPEEEEITDEQDEEIYYEKNYALSFTNAAFSNIALLTFNRYALNKEYAKISINSIITNLTSRWVWDQDEFAVNHIGHPYQGSFYYIAGRANNLNFAESLLVTLFGSVMWELFCETETPSLNDLIVTTTGAFAFGEMLHRLYMEALSVNFPLAFIISPMDALNRLVSGKNPPRPPSRITAASFYFGAGPIIDRNEFDSSRADEENRYSMVLEAGYNLVYGEPYGLSTKEPFSHFEHVLQAAVSSQYYSVSLFSDGILFSFAPFYKPERETTLGASLHYDVIFSKYINFSAHSVGFTMKQKYEFSKDAVLALRLHANWIIMSANDYFYLRDGSFPDPDPRVERRDYDLGTGEGFKFSLHFSQPVFGTIGFTFMFYGLHTIPASVPDYGSEGYTIINISNLSYEHLITKKISLGLLNSLYHKYGFYNNAPNIHHLAFFSTVYFRYIIR
ncbi:DUF3943 domain-containing protein [Brucepastera parasyntrophica]|uniref:DUF3943 domain-containing protein n=1 Tax=Brucepastera parasyntrophica TaxID=2880008 RepID=UPI00210E8E02|nr:DUF3943 domain-containing protein [Brucepastera parasyntrophica]ULQ60260.1 DUF3943 domain-containing protein [Brucepastera parasyntrophica]